MPRTLFISTKMVNNLIIKQKEKYKGKQKTFKTTKSGPHELENRKTVDTNQ